MEPATSAPHILVAEPAGSGAGSLRGAIERLGPEIVVEVVCDAAGCVRRCREVAVDLVVADSELAADCEQLLDALRVEGPPVVVVCPKGDDRAALAAFRRGAADCVTVGSPDVLAMVALEQVRRWRAIRERAQAERRIRDLERYNEHIIQNMNSALLVVDVEGKIEFCNPPAEQILGESFEALRGRAIWDWFRGSARHEILLARTLERGERFKGAETTIARGDGTSVPIGISCGPLRDSDGAKLGAVLIFQDLTEITLLQRQVLQREKLASIGQLAAGVAHEINNPMGFIHANLFQMTEYVTDLRRVWSLTEELLKASSVGAPQEIEAAAEALASAAAELDVGFVLSDLGKAVRESQEGSERIRHIVQDLQDFSHQDTGERALSDVNQCLDSTASIVWPMMKHRVVLEKDYATLPSIYCNSMQLKQVFMNLLVNAFQAIEAKVAESGELGCIRLSTQSRDEGVCISVSDTGIGIARDNLDRIFDPFFTTKKVGAGTGLGLSTSFSIVRRHGGSLRVESREGDGAIFHLVLPFGEPGESDVG